MKNGKILIGIIVSVVVLITIVILGIILMNNSKSHNSCVTGAWSTSKPNGCEYTTKTLVWRFQLLTDENGEDKWAWTIDVNYNGIVGSALPSDIDSSYEEYKYLSTEPKETYNDNQEHIENITVYIIK